MNSVTQELPLDEGFRLLSLPRAQRRIEGAPVTTPSGKSLYDAVRASGRPLKCWNCEAQANCFVVSPSSCAPGFLSLTLCCHVDEQFVEMTRDHIIPKSLGGLDVVDNLRVSCFECNQARGNAMAPEDLTFMQTHPELVGDPAFVMKHERRRRERSGANYLRVAQRRARQSNGAHGIPALFRPATVPVAVAPLNVDEPSIPDVQTAWADYNRATHTWSTCGD